MSWITPKTDWEAGKDAEGNYIGDFFNIEDYNRIKNNIKELREFAVELYPDFDIKNMGADKKYTDYPYADEINLIADNLETIKDKTYSYDIGKKVIYYDNSPFIGYEDLNRIESACLRLYKTIVAQKQGRRRLAFYLGRKERF